MSIVTLKKKVATQYENMSVNKKEGFSINGTRRSQGYVGQTMLSRSLPRTPMKGNVPKGHGGCCGKYPIKPIIQSGVNYLNNFKVVKPSVMNTKEMIQTKYFCVPPNKCVIKGKLNNTVKPDVNNHINTQQQYIDNLSKKTMACPSTNKGITSSSNCDPTIFKKQNHNYNYNPCYFKTDPTKEKYISHSEYLKNFLSDKCVIHDEVFVKTNTKKTPFACGGK